MMTLQNYQQRFITIEGIEGVGKSTAVKFIKQLLIKQQLDYISTREPGGTDVAEQIRQLLLAKHSEPIYPETELLLMFAARTQHLRQVIMPALAAGQWVLCDRFTDASYAYQGAGRAIPDPVIATLEQQIQQGLQPGLTILLDAPYEVSLQRMSQRAEKDRIEQEQQQFFDAVRAKYLKRAEEFPQRYRVINATEPLAIVQQQLAKVVQDYLASIEDSSLV